MDTEFVKYLFYIVGVIVGIIVIVFTSIYQYTKFKQLREEHDLKQLQITTENQVIEKRLEIAGIEKSIAEKTLKAIEEEDDIKSIILTKTAKITASISQDISKNLIDNQSWLERFMDETGVSYRASVYGKRINHFFYEKREIAKCVVEKLEQDYLKKDDSTTYYLIIDSGTTLYPVFQEISDRLKENESSKMWRERVCIITNNIPGVQYLMKHAKENLTDDYSEITIKCFIIPGKPLSVYAAITGTESTKWLERERLDEFIKEESNGGNFKILGFITIPSPKRYLKI